MQRTNQIDPIDLHVGKRLTFARNMRGMSQGHLGAMVGVSFQQIQKYECGLNRISASRLVHLATSLHMPVEWFFEQLQATSIEGKDLENHDPILGMNGDSDNQKETYRLVSTYYSIKDEQKRHAIFEVLKILAN